MSDNREFTVTVPKTYTFKEGWGVFVDPIHDQDEVGDREWIAEIDVYVVPIVEEHVAIIGGAPCVPLTMTKPESWVPVENFEDVEDLHDGDSHDLRTRWFATEDEARAHAAFVEQVWNHPDPWVSFIKI